MGDVLNESLFYKQIKQFDRINELSMRHRNNEKQFLEN